MSLFDDNCRALAERDPSLAAAVRMSAGQVLTVSQARSGVPTATAQGAYVHSAYDPVREAEAWADSQLAAWQPGEVMVVFGVGLLYHAEALRRRLPAEARLMVVVPDVRVLRDACAARPLADRLDGVEWAWGEPEAIGRFLADLQQPLRLSMYAPAASLHAEAHARIEATLRRAVAARAEGRLHVAVVGPLYGGSLPVARYAVSALEALGHRVTWIDHSPHHASYQIIEQLRDFRLRATVQAKLVEVLGILTLARLAEDPPDLLLALAQAPLTLPILERLRQKKFVTAIWFIENYRHLTYWQQLAAGYDFWFVFQRGACEQALREAGARQVVYLPLAADPAVHRPLALTAEERAEFGADVSCVGAGYQNRRAILPWLMQPDWTFKVWGNEWEGAGALKPVLQRGGARLDTETCVKVFNATTININLHSYTGDGLDPEPDSVNPRTFELAACGAFQVTDQRALLPELFGAEQLATFHAADELVPLVRRFLREPEARRAMADSARRRVLEEHTYAHRMRELLAHVGLTQPDRVGGILRGDRQALRLMTREDCPPALTMALGEFPPSQRVELKDLAANIRVKGPSAVLSRDELLVLMLDEYRQETRDLV